MAAKCTGLQTASQLIKTGYGTVTRAKVLTDGTNAATLILYDNTAESGKIIDKTVVPGASQYGGGNITIEIPFEIGLYVAVSGTGAAFIVDYN